MDFPLLDEETGQLMEYRQLHKHPNYAATWTMSCANEMGRLCQGRGRNSEVTRKCVKGTDTFFVVNYNDIPVNIRIEITYTSIICKVCPQKEDPNCTQITIGGNHICYPGDVGTPNASMELFKILVNIFLSCKGARFVCFDINNLYLGTPLDRPEYVRIHQMDIPQKFITEYNLTVHARDGWVYFCICKGVYGLPQAGQLTNNLLSKRLDTKRHYEAATTPVLWLHKWLPVIFCLPVDYFGIKYVGKQHTQHLFSKLQEHYTVTTDWEGKKYADIDLEWDYKSRT